MNYYNEELSNRFFRELALRLREAEIQTGQATAYHLPILYDGCQICEVNTAGEVTRHSTYLKSQESTAIYQRTIPIASNTREYMTAMETARPLLAEGLDPRDGYRLLAEFNGCVLASRYSEYQGDDPSNGKPSCSSDVQAGGGAGYDDEHPGSGDGSERE